MRVLSYDQDKGGWIKAITRTPRLGIYITLWTVLLFTAPLLIGVGWSVPGGMSAGWTCSLLMNIVSIPLYIFAMTRGGLLFRLYCLVLLGIVLWMLGDLYVWYERFQAHQYTHGSSWTKSPGRP